jgi:hypothetical protein
MNIPEYSYFREIRNNFGLKIFKFFDADPGWVKKIKIRDEHPGSIFRELRNNFLG